MSISERIVLCDWTRGPNVWLTSTWRVSRAVCCSVCVVSEYSAETGKAIAVREYLDTNKTFAVMTAHEL